MNIVPAARQALSSSLVTVLGPPSRPQFNTEIDGLSIRPPFPLIADKILSPQAMTPASGDTRNSGSRRINNIGLLGFDFSDVRNYDRKRESGRSNRQGGSR
jgi:hypothetical protein